MSEETSVPRGNEDDDTDVEAHKKASSLSEEDEPDVEGHKKASS